MKTKKYKRLMSGVIAAITFICMIFPAASFAGVNIPVTVDIPLTYIVSGNARAAGGGTFILTPDDENSPMPDGTSGGEKRLTVKDEGTYSFGEIHYERPDIHMYTVRRESADNKGGVTRDGSVYKVKVIALNDGHGYVIVTKEGSDEKCELVYMDRTSPKTGEDNRAIACGMIFLAAASLLGYAAAGRRGREDAAE